MNILQIVPHYLPSRSFGGVMQTAHSLGKALTRLGCRVEVCTTSMDTHTSDLAVLLDRPVTVDGIEVRYSQVLRQSVLRRWGVSWALLLNIWRALSRADLVILHFHFQFATWAGAWLCRLRRKPYIIFTHGSLNQNAIRASGERKKRAYLSVLEKDNFRSALFTAYQSPEELENSLLLNPRPVVIPNGIDPANLALPTQPGHLSRSFPQLKDRFVFLFLGRIDPNKGLDVLMPAFARVYAAHPQVHLLLAGPDERGYQSQVEEMARQHHLEQAVTFAGFISGELRAAALHEAGCFVLPSRYEGLSMALLEALYCGLPVITTPFVGLWKRLSEERCALISPLDEAQMADSMEAVLVDPLAARQMGQRGKGLVEREHNWDAIAVRLLEQLPELRRDRVTHPKEAVS